MTGTKPTLTISEVQPAADVPCGLCDDTTDTTDFTVTTITPEGRFAVCEECAEEHAMGLFGAAEALSTVYSALLCNVEQPYRQVMAEHCRSLAKLAEDLHSGTVVIHEKNRDGTTSPARVGGQDPHAVIRRHTMRAVEAN